jgi:signal transduction histidine kinase
MLMETRAPAPSWSPAAGERRSDPDPQLAPRQRLARLLERFVPAGLTDPQERHRARLVVGLSLAIVVWGPPFFIAFSAMGAHRMATVVAAALVLALGTGPVQGLTGSPRIAGIWLTFWFGGVATAISCLNGGYDSPSLLWLPGVVVIAVFLAGKRAGIGFAALALATYLTLFLLKRAGITFIDELGPERTANMRLPLELSFCGLLTTIALLYERLRDRAASELQALNRDLGRALAEQQTTREALEQAQAELVDKARRAGMAEVAAGVVHNLGNVLNSSRVSVGLAAERVRALRPELLDKSVEMLDKWMTAQAPDAREARLPLLLGGVARQWHEAKIDLQHELEHAAESLQRIEQLVISHRDYVSDPDESADLRTVVEEAIELALEQAEDPSIRIDNAIADIPPLSCDRELLLRILVHLLDNACEAAGGQGSRQIELSADDGPGGTFRLRVSDTGPGISEEHRESIFRYGFTTKGADRQGAGLHQSALAARELGGELRFESREPGPGSTFVLELPAGSSRR